MLLSSSIEGKSKGLFTAIQKTTVELYAISHKMRKMLCLSLLVPYKDWRSHPVFSLVIYTYGLLETDEDVFNVGSLFLTQECSSNVTLPLLQIAVCIPL